MKKLLFVFALLISLTAEAQQFSFEFWHNGYLILEGGDTLKGQLKYNLQSDLLQLRTDSHLETYTARKVVFFEIFDAVTKNYRKFYSLPYASNNSYKAPVFFELLTEGKMTLLTRENLEYKTYSSFYYYGSYTRLVLVNKYFLLGDSGNINEFRGKRNDWIYEMGNYGDEVQKYAKSNKLDFDEKKDLTRIIEYYNTFYNK
jgi:hypothetical protein